MLWGRAYSFGPVDSRVRRMCHYWVFGTWGFFVCPKGNLRSTDRWSSSTPLTGKRKGGATKYRWSLGWCLWETSSYCCKNYSNITISTVEGRFWTLEERSDKRPFWDTAAKNRKQEKKKKKEWNKPICFVSEAWIKASKSFPEHRGGTPFFAFEIWWE